MSNTPLAAAAASVFRDDLFDGQVALITGGGSGIGRGIADTLAGLGAHVVLASRKLERVEAAAAEIRAAGGKASAVAVDVRDADRVNEMIADRARAQGRIDLLVNNAAGNFYAPSETLSANAWKSVVEIDLYGTFFCSQAVLPVMKRAGGRVDREHLHDAALSRLAADGARDGGQGGDRRAHEDAGAGVGGGPRAHERGRARSDLPPRGCGRRSRRRRAPMAWRTCSRWRRRWRATRRSPFRCSGGGRPADIANMVAFLASPAGSWITGAIMVVDGGEWLAKPPMGRG